MTKNLEAKAKQGGLHLMSCWNPLKCWIEFIIPEGNASQNL
jgi:hypothetical protein